MKLFARFLVALALVFVAAPLHAQILFTGVGAGGFSGLVLPVDLISLDMGHSRPQACSPGIARTGAQTISIQSGSGTTGGMCGFYQSAVNNVMLKSITGGGYGVAASTSLSAFYRCADQGSYAANYNTGASSNPNTAFASTGNGNDKNWSPFALGGDWVGNHFQACGDPATIVVYDDGFNDPSTGSYYTSPTVTETTEAANIDEYIANGKFVVMLDQIPTGYSTAVAEKQTVTGAGPYTATATNATNHVARDNFPAAVLGSFISGGVMNQLGSVLTKVGSCGTTDLTYSVSGAVYTICPNGVSAPSSTTVFLTYAYGTPSTANNAFLYTVHQWEHATLAPARPKVTLAPCWDALQDPTDTTNHLAYLGMLDPGQAHFTWLGAMRCTDAFASAFNATYTGYTSKELPPFFNNWTPCQTNTTSTTYSSSNCRSAGTYTFPASMTGSSCPSTLGGMQIVTDGVVMGTSQASGAGWTTTGNSILGSTLTTGGAYNCAAGTWSFTISPAFNANFHTIEIRQDPGTGMENALLDASGSGTGAFGQTGTKRSWVTGAAGVTGNPTGWIQPDDTCLSNAVTAAVLTVTESHNGATTPTTATDADGTWPAVSYEVKGSTIATGCSTLGTSQIILNGTFTNPALFFPAIAGGSGERGSLRWKVEADSSGHVAGFMGVDFQISQTVTGTWIPKFATGSAAAMNVHSFSSGLIMDDLSLYNGPMVRHDVTPFMTNADMNNQSGPPAWNAATPKIIVGVAQNVPVHFKVTIWRARVRAAAE